MKILVDNVHGIETTGKRTPDGVLRDYAWKRLPSKETIDL